MSSSLNKDIIIIIIIIIIIMSYTYSECPDQTKHSHSLNWHAITPYQTSPQISTIDFKRNDPPGELNTRTKLKTADVSSFLGQNPVLSTSFRKSFFFYLLGGLHRSKFVNFCHDLMQNSLSNLPLHTKFIIVIIF